jgi:hypothetical protein
MQMMKNMETLEHPSDSLEWTSCDLMEDGRRKRLRDQRLPSLSGTPMSEQEPGLLSEFQSDSYDAYSSSAAGRRRRSLSTRSKARAAVQVSTSPHSEQLCRKSLCRKSNLPPVPSACARGFGQAPSVEKDVQAAAALPPTVRPKFATAPASLPLLDDGHDEADARSAIALPGGLSKQPVQSEVLRAALRKRAFASGQLEDRSFEVCEAPTHTEVFAPPPRDLSTRKAFHRSAPIQSLTMTELRVRAVDATSADGEQL